MRRYARLAVANVVSVLLVTGCSAGGYHDKQICQTLARAVSVAESSNRSTLWHSAVTEARIAARRPGYLSPRLARDLRAVNSSQTDLKIGPALNALAGDCQAVGVYRPVWLTDVTSRG